MCETADPRVRPGAAEPHTERAVSTACQDVPRPRLAGRKATDPTRSWTVEFHMSGAALVEVPNSGKGEKSALV